MAEPARVFVSHHHSPEEDVFTDRLVSDLEAAGADVWVDKDGIQHGSFVAKISEGMAGRQWLVLVMTPAALASPWVRSEVETAIAETTSGRMLGVLPLVMQPCAELEIPLLWRKLHRYDATKDYKVARDGLLRAIGLTPPLQSTSQASPQPSESHAAPLSALNDGQLPSLGEPTPIIPRVCDVPAGAFLMGSDPKKDKAASSGEQPQHLVTVPAFQIGRTPITVAEYASFWLLTGHHAPREWSNLQERHDHPVVNVTWHDAVAYAAWLAELTGDPWRLPTEAEWEKAARGTDGRIYPWGNTFDKTRCNTSEGGKGATTPVGSYPTGASPYGVLNMAGNVWEWTSSLYVPYPYSATDGRENPRASGGRVVRGGSWEDGARSARAVSRGDGDSVPVLAYIKFGFRLARAVPSS